MNYQHTVTQTHVGKVCDVAHLYVHPADVPARWFRTYADGPGLMHRQERALLRMVHQGGSGAPRPSPPDLRQRDIDKLALLSLDAYDYALETEKEHDDAIASSRRPPSPSSTGVKVRLEHH